MGIKVSIENAVRNYLNLRITLTQAGLVDSPVRSKNILALVSWTDFQY